MLWLTVQLFKKRIQFLCELGRGRIWFTSGKMKTNPHLMIIFCHFLWHWEWQKVFGEASLTLCTSLERAQKLFTARCLLVWSNRKTVSPLTAMTFPNSRINILLSACINSVSLITSSCPLHSLPPCLRPLSWFSYCLLESVEQRLPMEYVSFPSSATSYGY